MRIPTKNKQMNKENIVDDWKNQAEKILFLATEMRQMAPNVLETELIAAIERLAAALQLTQTIN